MTPGPVPTEKRPPLLRCLGLGLPPIALVALLTLLLLSITAVVGGAQGAADDLSLVDPQYTPFDSDGDGLDDAVEVSVTVSNSNETRSLIFVLRATLSLGATEVDVRTTSALLSAESSTDVLLSLRTDELTEAGTHEVRLVLYVEVLDGVVADQATEDVGLFPYGSYDLVLESNSTLVTVVENTTGEFVLNVTSHSNNPTGMEINVSSPGNWSFRLAPEPGTIDPEGTAQFRLEVLAPHNTPPGTREDLIVEVVALRNHTAFSTLTLTVMVEMRVSKLSLELASTTVYVASGGSTSTSGFVLNRGNNRDELTLHANVPPGWTVSFVPSGLTLDRGETGTFELTVIAPTNLAGSGSISFNVSARSEGLAFEDARPLRVVYNTAELVIDMANTTISPLSPSVGSSVTVQAVVVNTGSIMVSDVTVTVTVDGEEVGRASIQTIPVGGVGIASVSFSPSPGRQYLEVHVDPDDAIDELFEDNNVGGRSIDVSSPDLMVVPGGITIEPAYPDEGSAATILVVVENGNPVASGAFSVLLSIDGSLVRTFFVDTGLIASSNTTLEHEWTAVPGRHAFAVEVDPEGSVDEEDTSNNAASRSFSVNSLPLAVLAVSKDMAFVGDTITLDGSASSDPDGRVRQWYFDYGDGTDSGWTFSAFVNHTYSGKGTYEVRLYVRDEAGAQSGEAVPVNVTIKSRGGGKEPSPMPWGALALVSLGAATAVAVAARRAGRTG